MFKQLNLILLLLFGFSGFSIASVTTTLVVLPELVIEDPVLINEGFDFEKGQGSYGLNNHSGESIGFFAVGHSDSNGASTDRDGWDAFTASEAEWNENIIALVLEIPVEIPVPVIDISDYFFTALFPDSSYANIYFDLDFVFEGVIGESVIVSEEETGFQFFYNAEVPNSNFIAIGEGGIVYTGAANDVSNVPVPAAVWLFGSALIALIGYRKPIMAT